MLTVIKDINLNAQLNVRSWNFESREEYSASAYDEQCAYNERELVEYLDYPRSNKYYEH